MVGSADRGLEVNPGTSEIAFLKQVSAAIDVHHRVWFEAGVDDELLVLVCADGAQGQTNTEQNQASFLNHRRLGVQE